MTMMDYYYYYYDYDDYYYYHSLVCFLVATSIENKISPFFSSQLMDEQASCLECKGKLETITQQAEEYKVISFEFQVFRNSG